MSSLIAIREDASDPVRMSDRALVNHIEAKLVNGRVSLLTLKPWLQEAHRRFAQPGRRIPTPGRPTFGEWVREHTGYSDRWIRSILSDHHPNKIPRKRPIDKKQLYKLLANAGIQLANYVEAGDTAEADLIAKEILKIADGLPRI